MVVFCLTHWECGLVGSLSRWESGGVWVRWGHAPVGSSGREFEELKGPVGTCTMVLKGPVGFL